MRTLVLQDEEADQLESIIDALLIDPNSKALEDGKIRRGIRRVSMKLYWARRNQQELSEASPNAVEAS